MTKRGVLLSIIFSLALTIMLPFSISANGSLSAPFVGYNVYEIQHDSEYSQFVDRDVEVDLSELRFNCLSYGSSGACSIYGVPSSGYNEVSQNIILSGAGLTYTSLYQVDLILDADYIGHVTLSINDGSSTYTRTYYVNGDMITFTWSSSTSISVSSYSLEKRNDNSLMWMFPIESFNIINQQFKSGYEVKEYFNQGNYIFPVFSVPSGSTIGQLWSGGSGIEMFFIFGINRNLQLSNYSNVLEITNANVTRIDELYFSDNMTIKKFFLTSTNTSGGFVSIKLKSAQYYMPIFFNTKGSQSKLSTDFALNYGMTNPLLDNISTITNNTNTLVNGTTGSNQTASNVTNESSNLTDVSDDIHNMESDFNSDLNNNLQAIDTTVTPGTFGSSFLSSASWVKTQFDQLTSNTPFGSVLSFSLVLGLGLLIVGRALK